MLEMATFAWSLSCNQSSELAKVVQAVSLQKHFGSFETSNYTWPIKLNYRAAPVVKQSTFCHSVS